MTVPDPVAEVGRQLGRGAIVAIKGLGGYHLACDAENEKAVHTLRSRKHREEKPFALMAPDLGVIRLWCEVDFREEELLVSRRRPIVLLRRRPGCPVASSVAPGQRTLGFMLPYTPLHHLLLRAAGRVLVLTSGNRSDEPIAHRDDEAVLSLSSIADAFLVHNREIHIRCDDSVTRLVGGQELLVRRARGYAPEPIELPFAVSPPVLASGGHLKNTFCLASGRRAFVSQHIGDLENYETYRAFAEGIEHFQHLFGFRPEAVAYDLHPDYFSTKYALQLEGIAKVAVQHHHAHVASCMAEHGIPQGPVLGVAFDGTGYGRDGTLWGGEFLVAEYRDFVRAGHLEVVPLPGGDAAIREPWRSAAAWLNLVYGKEIERLEIGFVKRLDLRRWRILNRMLERRLHCPVTSSVGRLFDAVASLAGIRDVVHYEGQAAVELEMVADESCSESYPWSISPGDFPIVLGVQELIRAIVKDLQRGTPAPLISAKFHNSLVEMIVSASSLIRQSTGVDCVVLSGGVFQNALLLQRVVPRLKSHGFRVLVPQKVPPNDGGISLGQAAVAAARMS